MELSLLISIVGVLALTGTIYSFWQSSVRKGKYKLPPLVPGAPLFGNTFQVPLIQQGPWAKKLAEKYGEM